MQSICTLVDGIRKDAKGREVGFRVSPPNHHEPRALRKKAKQLDNGKLTFFILALSRDVCNFRQDGLKTPILCGFEKLLHQSQKSLYLQKQGK